MTSGWQEFQMGLRGRKLRAILFHGVCVALTSLSLVILCVLLYHVCVQGLPQVDWHFLTNSNSYKPARAGVYSALWGSIWLATLTAGISIPIGVSAAIYLEEYGRKTRLNSFIDVNIANLAGVPSIVYGVLGLAVFVHWLSMGESLISGACTMSLLVLPLIIIASREAIRAVPQSTRLAAFALGATRWQTVRHHVLPAALPGIMTGLILSMSRSIGETAPLIVTGAVGFITYAPTDLHESAYTVLPLQIYDWTGRPQPEFKDLAAAGILVLLVVLLMMNATAVYIRHRTQKEV